MDNFYIRAYDSGYQKAIEDVLEIWEQTRDEGIDNPELDEMYVLKDRIKQLGKEEK